MQRQCLNSPSGLLTLGLLAALALPCRPAAAQFTTRQARPPRQAPQAVRPEKAIETALERYLTESEAALDARMAGLAAFFEQRKANARPFAKSLLSIWGKISATGSLMDDMFTQLSTGERKPTTACRKLIEDAFRKDVLDRDKARQAADDAMAGFLGDLAEAEAKLLVRLKADFGDGQLALPGQRPALVDLGQEHYDAMISATASDTITDLGVSIGMFFASNAIGDAITQQITDEKTPPLEKMITGFVVGQLVDAALGEAAKAAGYDPEKAIAGRVAQGLDRMSRSIIEGDPVALGLYPALSILRRTHPDPAVRAACTRADEAVMRTANLGLRERLRRLRNDRYRRLWTVLTGASSAPRRHGRRS